jgi:uncharacterized damage-inducible protein DinB
MQLSAQQLAQLRNEGDSSSNDAAQLGRQFSEAVDAVLQQLKNTDGDTLLHSREVGRGRLPSTVIGLLFHAAEHTQRHVGQATTTAKIIAAR